MKLLALIAIASIALAADAPKPITLDSAAKLKIRESEVAFLDVAARMQAKMIESKDATIKAAALEKEAAALQAAATQKQQEMRTAITDAANAAGCADGSLDETTYTCKAK